MSQQLSLSAAFSAFTMALFALAVAAGGLHGASSGNANGQQLAINAPALVK